MNSESSTVRRAARWLLPGLALTVACAAASGAEVAQWQIEPIGASEGVRELHDLSFDGQGRALLSWDADLLGHVPPVFGGLATRDPAGGWQRPPNLAAVDPASAQVHVLAAGGTLLVAREGGPGGPGRRRLVVAAGGSDGGFGPLVTLAAFTARSWSAANASGDAIVAWTNERTRFLTVRERMAGADFGPPRDLALARSAAVAISDRGDRVLAWPDGRRIAVRVRRAGGSWGRVVRFGRLPADRDRRLTALITPSGRILVTWGRDRGDCGVAVRDRRGSWHLHRLEVRCGSAAVGSRGAPVIPVVDSGGATYVAWTHATPKANSVTLARVAETGLRGRAVISRQRGALLDDIAAGPDRAMAVTWAAVLSPRAAPLQTATYAGLRRAGAAFEVRRLSTDGVLVARGSRVAFHPLTGQAVVAIPFAVGRTVAVGAAVSALVRSRVSDADLMQRSAGELAALVRSGELSATELVDAALRRIEQADPAINAFVDVDVDGARAAAAAIAPGDERPFAGVPIAIKGNRGVAGLRLTRGAAFTGDGVARADHNVTRRLRGAGFVVLGTTNMPEWGILPVCEPRRFGATRNPWDPARTPGGSSGGSAAAVAAGMVPLAHGNDGGGSLRIPAACCGLVGLKPQRGRISQAPDAGHHLLVVDGVLTRTVGETAQLLDVLAGPEPGDASWAPTPVEPFARSAERVPRGLRIGVTTLTALLDADLHPACERAAADAAELLASLGHEVEPVQPPWRRPGLLDLFAKVFGPAVCSSIGAVARVRGREPREADMEALSWALWQASRGLDAVQAELAAYELQAFARAIVTWSAPYDALLTPTLAQPPLAIGTLDADGPDPLDTFERSGHFTPYTAISNVTGSPAISLPLYEHEGLPLGVQLIGRPAQEGALLALAAQLEQALPWAGRRPAIAR